MRARSRWTRAAGLLGMLVLLTLAVQPAGARAEAFTLGGVDCDLIKVPARLPFGPPTTCAGVRPGALVETPKGFCTLNFLFNGSDGRRYIGTAGHCVLGDSLFSENVGERRWSNGTGPWAKDSRERRIGEFVYAVLKEPKDFALIRLDPGVYASPSMCHFGGPVGMNRSTAGPEVLHYYGNGLGIGEVLPARTAVATRMDGRNHVYANGVIAWGDSGGGVITDGGRAVGVLVTFGTHSSRLSDTGVIGITKLAPQVSRAAYRLGITLTLRTAKLAP